MDIPLLVEALAWAVATLLFSSGVSKLVAPRSIRRTVAALGVPPPVATRLALLLGAGEVVAAALVGAVRGLPAAMLVAVLGCAFAGAAAWSMATGRDVACNCLGRHGGDAPLGWRQLVALPLWLAVAAVMVHPLARAAVLEHRLVTTYLALLAAFAVTARHLVPAVLGLRAIRLAARPQP